MRVFKALLKTIGTFLAVIVGLVSIVDLLAWMDANPKAWDVFGLILIACFGIGVFITLFEWYYKEN